MRWQSSEHACRGKFLLPSPVPAPFSFFPLPLTVDGRLVGLEGEVNHGLGEVALRFPVVHGRGRVWESPCRARDALRSDARRRERPVAQGRDGLTRGEGCT